MRRGLVFFDEDSILYLSAFEKVYKSILIKTTSVCDAQEIVTEKWLIYIYDYDHADIIDGQYRVGMKMYEEVCV